jgi:hypothetical protein
LLSIYVVEGEGSQLYSTYSHPLFLSPLRHGSTGDLAGYQRASVLLNPHRHGSKGDLAGCQRASALLNPLNPLNRPLLNRLYRLAYL